MVYKVVVSGFLFSGYADANSGEWLRMAANNCRKDA